MAIGFGEACQKPEPRKKSKGRQERLTQVHVKMVRGQVFTDHDDRCVVCHGRAESMHELIPASVVGDRILATTVDNSVPVCGSGTTGCHGLLQSHVVRPIGGKSNAIQFVIDVEQSTHPEVRALLDRHAEWRRSKWEAHQ